MKNQDTNTRQYFVISLFIIIGGILLFLSIAKTIPKPYDRYAENIGISFLTTGIIGLLYELYLRKTYIDRAAEAFQEIIDKKLPARYRDLRKSGIYSAFEKLNPNKISTYIDGCSMDSKICFLKIWISNIESIRSSIIDAVIKKNCTVRILLLNPDSSEPIEKRACAIKNNHITSEYIINEINRNIEYVTFWREEVKNIDPKKIDNIQLKLHSSFISCSLIRIQNEMTIGYYLRDRSSYDAIHVHYQGRNTSHFSAFVDHFNTEWDDPKNKVIFPENK